MRHVLMLAVVLAGSPAAAQSAFCEGFEAGYKAGACYGKTYCTPPFPPVCPFPRVGEDSYQDGYNRGFLSGVADQR